MDEVKGKIENWYVATPAVSPYTPPEALRLRFFGNLGEKHKVFSDPVSYNPSTGVIKTSSGSKYYLGDPKEDYEEAYPDAKARFIKGLEIVMD